MSRKEEIMVDNQGRYPLRVEMPSNSYKARAPSDKKDIKKVVTGKVLKQKKSLGKRLTEDIGSVTKYIFTDILIPSTKNAISDMVAAIFDMSSDRVETLLFGQVKSKTSRLRNNQASLNNYYYKPQKRHEITPRARALHQFDDIVIVDRGEAELVLSQLTELIDVYGLVSVAELYNLLGITSEYTDHKYGWDNLSSSRIAPVRGGYLLDLPKPEVLD